MAQKSIVYKAELNVSDMDRHYYASHNLTLARHPSETDERMMLRVFAFARHADEALAFGRGISTDDEADVWLKDLTGVIKLWVDLGQPDEKWLRKACGRAEQVVIYAYGTRSADVWWQQQAGKVERLDNLSVFHIPPSCSQALAGLAQRSMKLQCTIQDGSVWLADDTQSVEIQMLAVKA